MIISINSRNNFVQFLTHLLYITFLNIIQIKFNNLVFNFYKIKIRYNQISNLGKC